jgi:type II secretory pathway component GspD/PulD (secretin)
MTAKGFCVTPCAATFAARALRLLTAALLASAFSARSVAQPQVKAPATTAAPASTQALPDDSANPPASAPAAAPAATAPLQAGPNPPAPTQQSAEQPATETPPAVPATSAPGSPQPGAMVRLNFQEQPWLSVLEWLATAQGLNLDWQKLPEGTLNLSSTKEYGVEEAEDVINMQLLARGFTLLKRGEVLRLAPLENIDITLVPKVDAAELADLPRHQFVRVSFPLDWMLAEEAANEFKPLISPHGKLFPMASSNRLEAMDAVVNLRELHRLLTRAEADEGRRERVAEFRLKHRKAEEVAIKVRQLLGLPDVPAPAQAMETQLDIEKVKFRSEAVKQLGANAQQFLTDKPDVHLVVNDKENSILVNGRPDKIEIARQAIEAIDKPLPSGDSAWESINRVKVHEVSGFDPATIAQLMQALQERGNISKETRIQHEAAYNRLIVFASPEDHLVIANIIESFRTHGRRAEVLPLTQIDPQYATKAVQLVLKNFAKPAVAGAPGNGDFQIEPDVAHKRLLLWATPAEVAEVREFLARLGENSVLAQARPQMHVVHLRGANADEVTQRLKRVWEDISDAPLVIEPSAQQTPTPSPAAPPPSDQATPPAAAPTSKPEPPAAPADNTAQPMSIHPTGPTAQLVVQQRPVPPEGAAKDPPPSLEPPTNNNAESAVRVIAGSDDNDMFILSRDPVAAEAAKQLVEKIVPAEDDVRIIQLKHAQAALVETQLEALVAHTQPSITSPLSTEKPLGIESDSRTNRLMVQHASPRQMELVDQMIRLLDQPEQEDSRLVRQQRIYRVQRKRASEVAEVVKEVYRDLLSSSDKVFAGQSANRPFGYNRALAATVKSPEYQGLLSVGVDIEDNTLVLSAPAYLLDEVMALVKLVDTSADDKTVRVVPLKSAAARESLKEALGRLFAEQQ